MKIVIFFWDLYHYDLNNGLTGNSAALLKGLVDKCGFYFGNFWSSKTNTLQQTKIYALPLHEEI